MLAKTNTMKKTKLSDDSLNSSTPSTPNALTFVASNDNDLIDLDAPENETNVTVVIQPQGRKKRKDDWVSKRIWKTGLRTGRKEKRPRTDREHGSQQTSTYVTKCF
ncbi:hypothetical protein ACP275_14G137900 [Erythranthe tilingii]